MQGRILAGAAGTAIVCVVASGCAATTDSAGSGQSAQAAPAASAGVFTVFPQPDTKGSAVLGAIAQAQVSIDIPIYEINDPQINKALMDAKARGVNIRTVQNGQWWQTKEQTYVPAGIGVNTDFAKALSAAPGPGTFAPHWSNNNFSITHQKSVIVDAADGAGQALPAAQLPSSAIAVISTGNFNAYSYSTATGECTSASEPCTAFSARDYELSTPDPGIISEMESVFLNDFGCSTRTTIVPSGLTAADTLVWSNGTTGANPADAAGQYPSVAEGYPMWVDDGGNVEDQGNSRAIIEKTIDLAKPGDILRVTNEEMADGLITGYLAHAAASGVDVRIVMTYPSTSSSSGQKQLANLQKIANAGAKIRLFNSDALYIHSKTVSVQSGSTLVGAYVGSENFSQGSLEFNRELGAQLTTGDETAMTVLNDTFDTDFATTANTSLLPAVSPTASPSPSSSPAKGSKKPNPAPAVPGADQSEPPSTSTPVPAMTCGPISVS